jgi:hypothetical protein
MAVGGIIGAWLSVDDSIFVGTIVGGMIWLAPLAQRL